MEYTKQGVVPCFLFFGFRDMMNNVMEHKNQAKEFTQKIIIVSVGQHTRLGDALEYAVEGIPFETVDAGELTAGNWKNCRVLFAASADRQGDNASMRVLSSALLTGKCDLSGSVCAMIADGEQGGAIHLDAIRLLLVANAAGAEIISRPLLEGGRNLNNLAGETGGRETGFARYQTLARMLTLRFMEYDVASVDLQMIRFASALDAGVKNDWRVAIRRMMSTQTKEISEDDAEAEETILLCENTDGLPDAKTLALLGGGGRIRFIVASPETGGDLYTAALFERACLRGKYSLAPCGITLFEGKSAVEALASRVELERVKTLFGNNR